MSHLLSSSTPLALLPRLLSRYRSFTAREVRHRLGLTQADDPRTAAVHAMAAQTGLWSGRLPDRLALDLGATASRLPSVVYWYRQGHSPHVIGRRLSRFGGAWDAERALGVAAGLIAEALNDGARAERAA